MNITGNKFYDWKQMKGGGGAIDLVMHVNKCDIEETNWQAVKKYLIGKRKLPSGLVDK